jgi:hypothetical protein
LLDYAVQGWCARKPISQGTSSEIKQQKDDGSQVRCEDEQVRIRSREKEGDVSVVAICYLNHAAGSLTTSVQEERRKENAGFLF